MKEKLQNIQFLTKPEQKELLLIFIKTCNNFFEKFESNLKNKDTHELRKACHNFGSSMIVFELDHEVNLLESIQKSLHKNDIASSKKEFKELQKGLYAFIEFLRIELNTL